jgi:hypothetical protein
MREGLSVPPAVAGGYAQKYQECLGHPLTVATRQPIPPTKSPERKTSPTFPPPRIHRHVSEL